MTSFPEQSFLIFETFRFDYVLPLAFFQMCKVCVRKNRTPSKLAITKEIHNFCPNLMKLGENEPIILTKFHKDLIKIVDFLLMANF